jgi:hypothetical protein
MTMSYSPTANCASIFTPRLSAFLSAAAATDWGMAVAVATPPLRFSCWQGSCSQYSTRRGAESASSFEKISRGSVFTFSF